MLLAFGALYYAFVLRPRGRVEAAAGWTKTPCTVEDSGLTEGRGRRVTDTFHVRFRYTVGGREYQSDRHDLGVFAPTSHDRDEVQKLVERYPAGQPADCYLNPEDPADAVLDRSPPAEDLGPFPAALLIAGGVVLLGLLLMGWKLLRRARARAVVV
jgi:hypothetical protein